MRITPGTSSIQMLKAQQAWEARRAARTATPQETALAPETRGPERPERRTIDSEPQNFAQQVPQWRETVREVQQIAEKAGYVGVTEQDIRRAYTQGESLLADYRV